MPAESEDRPSTEYPEVRHHSPEPTERLLPAMSSTESEPSKKAVAAVPKVVDSVVAGGNVVHADVVATVQKSPVCMHPQGVIDDWTAPSFDKVSFQTTFIASVPKSLTYC